MGIQVERVDNDPPHLICQRLAQHGNATTGLLIVNCDLGDRGDIAGGVCWVLEDIDRDTKIYGETRIPQGDYPLIKRTWGGKFERYRDRFGHAFIAEIGEVPNYSDVLIHIGNTANNTAGCLLVGSHANKTFGHDPDADPTIGHSTKAYLDLYQNCLVPLFAEVERPILSVRDEDWILRP